MDFKVYRDEFPITQNHVYLDHAGVGPVSLRVLKAVGEFLEIASESGIFEYEAWMSRVERVRKQCSELIGAPAEDVAFVKNTSHGLSIVASGLDWKQGDNVVYIEHDFPANVYPWLALGKKGVEVRRTPLNNFRFGAPELEHLIDSKTKVVAISSCSFWNGFMPDIASIAGLCRARGAYLFVDAIQSLGVAPMDVVKLGVDFLAADGHKWLMAPEGTGIFYCRPELAELIDPPLIGWKSVVGESDYDNIDFTLKKSALRFEEGSLNVMGIYALGAAVELLTDAGIPAVYNRVQALGDRLIEGIERRGFELKTPRDKDKRAGIICFSGDFDPNGLKEKLMERGIMVNVRGGFMRVAPHFYNTENEIEALFEVIDDTLKG